MDNMAKKKWIILVGVAVLFIVVALVVDFLYRRNGCKDFNRYSSCLYVKCSIKNYIRDFSNPNSLCSLAHFD